MIDDDGRMAAFRKARDCRRSRLQTDLGRLLRTERPALRRTRKPPWSGLLASRSHHFYGGRCVLASSRSSIEPCCSISASMGSHATSCSERRAFATGWLIDFRAGVSRSGDRRGTLRRFHFRRPPVSAPLVGLFHTRVNLGALGRGSIHEFSCGRCTAKLLRMLSLSTASAHCGHLDAGRLVLRRRPRRSTERHGPFPTLEPGTSRN